MIIDLRAATLADAEAVADIYLRSRKELVAFAPLVQAIAFGDGSGNEEKCPDILYEWTGAPVRP